MKGPVYELTAVMMGVTVLALWGTLAIGCSEDGHQDSTPSMSDFGPDDGPMESRTDTSPASDAVVTDAGGGSDATPDMEQPSSRSAGCGVESDAVSGAYEIDVDGVEREFHVVFPEDYDAQRAYTLIFFWHGLGGSAERVVSGQFIGLGEENDGSAILVAGQGLLQPNPLNPSGPQRAGWADRGNADVNFTRALLARMRAEYCIDNDRIFSAGVSYGGVMTNRVGCEMADEFRAIAPVMGQGPESWRQSNDCSMRIREANCAAGQVAAWITHGTEDTTVPYCGGERSRDYWQAANGCGAEASPVGENGCVEYADCDEGFPVVWCQKDLGHFPPAFAGQEIWSFFSRF